MKNRKPKLIKSSTQKIPTLFGVVILIVGLAIGLILINSQQIFKLGADESDAPQNVRITNINSSAFSVSWTTRKETSGFVIYGESERDLKKIENDELDRGTLHHVSISGLDASKTYYFKINSESYEYDNNGIPWQAKTASQMSLANSEPITGTVLTSTGTPASNVLVYLNTGGASPLSTVTSQNGSYVFPLSNLKNTNLTAPFSLSEDSTILEVSVQAGALGVSSAQITAKSGRPSPPLLLGQVHDFKSLPQSLPGKEVEPEADINSPTTETIKKSRFQVDSLGQTETQGGVNITSIDEGETIYTQKPEIFGEGPAGTEITITVHSTPITDSTVVDSSGSWDWTPPINLDPGAHTLTISYRDTQGILRQVTRSFTVLAAEDGSPSFESTPSATPVQTVTPTVTPLATVVGSSTPLATSISTATPVPQPDSGIPLPTLLIFLFGSGLFTSGIYLAFNKNE